MKNKTLTAIQSNWPPLADILTYPKNDKEYKYKLELMNELLKMDLPDEHPVSSFIDLLGDIVDEYEKSNFEEVLNLEKTNASSIDKIKHLMNEYNLKQIDLVDVIGSQGYVSDILNGKRELNIKHIKGLAVKFNVNAKSLL